MILFLLSQDLNVQVLFTDAPLASASTIKQTMRFSSVKSLASPKYAYNKGKVQYDYSILKADAAMPACYGSEHVPTQGNKL